MFNLHDRSQANWSTQESNAAEDSRFQPKPPGYSVRFELAFAICALLNFNAILAVESNSAPKLTFNKDVAPIVFEHCAGCHRPGQPGPFSLVSYDDVKKRSKQIAEVVEKRYMPPWLPAHGHGEFLGDRSLTPQQISTIRNWVGEGSAEGSPSDLPPLPKWNEGWRLGQPDLVVQMPQPYTLSADGKDVYRNFVFSIPVSGRKFVRGVEFSPGNPKVVHHAFITVDSTQFSRNRAKDSPPGFDGMLLPETAVMPGGQFLGWQPGKSPSFAPDGLAWILETNTDLVLQLHMHPSGKPETVQPSVAFFFTTQPPTNMAFRINLNPLIIDIPAGSKDYSIHDEYTLPIDVELIGISPHAHYLGKRLEGNATLPGGTKKDLLLISDWDFNWQGDYRYANPVLLPKGTTLGLRFSFDNSTNNPANPNHPPVRVTYGLETKNEMAELAFQMLAHNVGDLAELQNSIRNFTLNDMTTLQQRRLAQNPNDAEALSELGKIQQMRGDTAGAENLLRRGLAVNPDSDDVHYNLGVILFTQNKLAEAEQEFVQTIRLNPESFKAHNNAGLCAYRRAKLDDAELHFREALRLNPGDTFAKNNLELVERARRGEIK